jgi:hypothetical protein
MSWAADDKQVGGLDQLRRSIDHLKAFRLGVRIGLSDAVADSLRTSRVLPNMLS